MKMGWTYRAALIAASLLLLVATTRADFPQRPAARTIADGIQLCEVALTGDGPGQATKLQIYLPPGDHAAKSLACVFVAPAGTSLMTGIALADGDRPEHLPYVKAGFAVIAYDLDGPVAGRNDAAVLAAVTKFVAAHGGVDNARAAVDYALARVPEVDPNRLYVAGHSSAGTVALDVAAADARVRACCAYAPCPNLRNRLKPAVVAEVNRHVAGFDAFVDAASPARHVDALKGKPVLLFTAEDDKNVPPQSVKDFAAALQQAGGTQTKLETVAHGGHFDSMIAEGIPRGIAFLKDVDAHVRTP